MENQLQSFIEYLYIIEEGDTANLTSDQFQKLSLIKDKVSEIVAKVETAASSQVVQQVLEPALSEHIVNFADYSLINEKIAKRGKNWVVLDSKGKKVLGTHPNKEKAVKQLQAIEISKMKSKR